MATSKKDRMKLTERQEKFIEVYRKHGGNINKVCEEMGITTAGVNQYLSQDKVKEQLNKSVQIAREKIEAALPAIIDKAINMINSEDVSDKVKSQLMNSLLDRGGLVSPKNPPISININTEISERARTLLAQTMPENMEN